MQQQMIPFQDQLRTVADATATQKRRGQYRPIPSVWEGEDRDLLELMLDFYPREQPRRILDATINHGRFWQKSQRPVIGLDIEGRYCPNVIGDNMNLPFRDCAFDVVVYDPPHVPNQGKDKQTGLTLQALSTPRSWGYATQPASRH
ncbi:MAG: hypothetical protein ACRD2L_26315 [Terriglobia bacterium]